MADDNDLFREFEHTGDLGIELNAPTRAAMFARAATALGRLMVEADGIVARERRRIEVRAATDADLMHDLLADALNLFLADGFIWREVNVEERGDSLLAEFAGESFDPSRHQLLTEIKAVTYHELQAGRAGAQWRARILFDI
ncbi:MAG TPA: archease [Candidatus Binataceae bacterium]|nr:archease [Candidatus Binataceae bacterium]